MLEICPSPLCAYGSRVPCRGHSTVAPNSRRSCVNWGGRHSRPFPGQAAAVRDRVTPPGPALLRNARSPNSRRRIITILESYSCRMRKRNPLKSYSCGKIGGHAFPRQLCCFTFNRFRFKAIRMSRYEKSARNPSRICTYGFIRLKVPLESALTSKVGGGYPPAVCS
jgi:hypothetical protein